MLHTVRSWIPHYTRIKDNLNKRVRRANYTGALTINATRIYVTRGEDGILKIWLCPGSPATADVIAIFEFHERKPARDHHLNHKCADWIRRSRANNPETESLMPRFRGAGGERREREREREERWAFIELSLNWQGGASACYLPGELACQKLVIDLKKCPNKMLCLAHCTEISPRWYAPV